MIYRHLVHLWRQIHCILTHVCLHQIGCLYYCCYAKTSSPAVQKRHSKVFGNPIAPSFYSILLDTVYAELNSGMYSKAYVGMNLGMHDRLSEISFRETKIIFKNIFPYENMSRAQKVMQNKCVKFTCSMETVQQNGGFTLFSS